MSKYMINKLMLAIDATDASIEEYKNDHAGFVSRWEAVAVRPAPPWPEGGTLTDEERAAFASGDYATLYRLGAHPYVLWQWWRDVSVPERPIADLVEEFRAATLPLGYPDYAT